MTAQKKSKAKIDYHAFLKTSEEAEKHRQNRLIPLDTFANYTQDATTIILDTRSKNAFQKKHIKGAIHLNFSDFTSDSLAAIIPSKNTRILIYCNNNIDDDPITFPMKKMPLALNIPTFINLYGYGYKNIYELSSLISIKNPKITFIGTDMD